MAVHYSAFISYRHHPEDIRVATEIQHSLERFPVPRALKKQNKRIDRLFRDKEELPITSDINEDIEQALQNSDYLIVICSTHTKDSLWVQREIETFLKYHRRSRILTVLVDGEPYDVIPKCLQETTVTDPVTGQQQTQQIEPLSCDWRLSSRRQRHREELPRLAAALLECSYDELRQRQRQHRQRRLIAVFSASLAASLALAAYFMYNSIRIYQANQQIRANYEASLKNQSMYLAAEAREQLAAGDRLLAVALARAALPAADRDRPFVAEAEYVLTKALGVYNMRTEPQAVGAISLGANAQISEMFLSPDGKVLALYDRRGQLTFWDPEAIVQTGAVTLQDHVYGDKVCYTRQNNVVLEDGGKLFCYAPDGDCLWQVENCYKFAFFRDDDRILAIRQTSPGREELLLIQPESGEITVSAVLPELREMWGYSFCLEENYRQLPVLLSQFRSYGSTEHYLLDPDTGALTPFRLTGSNPVYRLLEDGRLLCLEGKTDALTGYIEGNRLSAATEYTLSCCSIFTGEQLWQTQITIYAISPGDVLEKIPGSDRILFATGTSFMVLDAASGQLLSRCDAGSGIVTCRVEADKATAVLEDGYICNFWYDEAYCYETKSLMNDLTDAAIGEGYVTLREKDNRLTVYRPLTPSYEKVHDFLKFASVSARFSHGQLLAECDCDSIYLLDAGSGRELWRISRTGLTLLGFREDGSQIYAVQDNAQLLVIDRDTGAVTELPLPVPEEEGTGETGRILGSYQIRGSRVYYLAALGQDSYLCAYGPDTDAAWQMPLLRAAALPQDVKSTQAELLAVGDTHAWVWAGRKVLLEVELSTGSLRQILQSPDQKPDLAQNGDGTRFAAAYPDGVVIWSADSEPVLIPARDGKPGRVFFLEEQLLVLCDDGSLLRYDMAGQLLSKTMLDVGTSYVNRLWNSNQSDARLEVYMLPDRLMVNVFGVCNIIDRESWSLQGSLENCITYLAQDRKFLCRDENSDYVAFPCYTTGELVALAGEQLRDYMLTDSQKAAYGLNG